MGEPTFSGTFGNIAGVGVLFLSRTESLAKEFWIFYMGSDAGWKLGGGSKGRFNSHNEGICEYISGNEKGYTLYKDLARAFDNFTLLDKCIRL